MIAPVAIVKEEHLVVGNSRKLSDAGEMCLRLVAAEEKCEKAEQEQCEQQVFYIDDVPNSSQRQRNYLEETVAVFLPRKREQIKSNQIKSNPNKKQNKHTCSMEVASQSG